MPLYARLSAAEQQRIFQPHNYRRIVLATNIAETSLTVPGIRYVIDPGTARISRYSPRTKVQRLPIEAISQASANQRSVDADASPTVLLSGFILKKTSQPAPTSPNRKSSAPPSHPSSSRWPRSD